MRRPKHDGGYTLVFTLGLIAMLATVGAMLAGPSRVERKRIDWHYRQVQAQCLSLAGLEEARSYAARNILTNELYLLANGTVDTSMEAQQNHTCRIVSRGRVQAPGSRKLIVARTETIVPLP
jgi:hypothetical protein